MALGRSPDIAVDALRRRDHAMLHGVIVDDLTNGFLKVATDPMGGQSLSEGLRVFFHDVRNRLNTLKIGIYLAKRNVQDAQAGLWSELEQTYRGLEQLVERIQTICRPPEISTIASDLGPWFEERRQVWTLWFDSGGSRLELSPPDEPATGRFDAWRLIQGLDALISWRAADARPGGRARLTWGCDPTHFSIEWAEESSQLSRPLEGGDGRSVSLALPLLAHVMNAHGGVISVSGSDGLIVQMTWPRSLAPTCCLGGSGPQSSPGMSASP
jgi:hypothetical protein